MKKNRKNSQHNLCIHISEDLEDERNFAGNERVKEYYGQRESNTFSHQRERVTHLEKSKKVSIHLTQSNSSL